MTVTKTKDALRSLMERLRSVSDLEETKRSEIAEGERAVINAEAAKAAGTASTRDVSLAKLDLHQLKAELEPLATERSEIERQIETEQAARVAAQKARDVRKLGTAASPAIVGGIQELADLRMATIRAMRAFLNKHAEICEWQGKLLSVRHFLEREEGLSREQAIKELRSLGVDIEGCNVQFSGSGRTTPFSDVLRPAVVRFDDGSAEGQAFDQAVTALGYH